MTLDCPVLPAMEGDDVHLRCRSAAPSPADFYKDDVRIGSSATGNFTIRGVSKSDEGRYKCNVSRGAESAQCRVTVTGEDAASQCALRSFILNFTIIIETSSIRQSLFSHVGLVET